MKILLIALVILYISKWIYKYTTLILNNSYTLKAFSKIEALMEKRFDIILKMLNTAENSENKENINKYIQQIKSLPKDKKYINRKLALNYLISKNLSEIIKSDNFSDEYKVVELELQTFGTKYNKQAEKLKICTEIFPASFIARFINIKVFNYYRG